MQSPSDTIDLFFEDIGIGTKEWETYFSQWKRSYANPEQIYYCMYRAIRHLPEEQFKAIFSQYPINKRDKVMEIESRIRSAMEREKEFRARRKFVF